MTLQLVSRQITDADRRHCLARLCKAMPYVPSDAREDAVQTGLLRAWATRDRFDGRCAWRSWLTLLCRNAAVDAWRRREAHVCGTFDGALPDRQPCGGGQEARVLLRELPVGPLLLARADGHSMAAIAAHHRLPVGTVKSRIHRQRRRLLALTRTSLALRGEA